MSKTGSEARPQGVAKSYLQYSGLFFFYCASTGVNAFVTVYLQGIGMNAAQVGAISALNSAVSIVALPLWGALSDRVQSVKKVFLLATALASLVVPLIPVLSPICWGPVSIAYLIIPASCVFRNPTQSLLENWVISGANRRGLKYGSIRLWGSISYAIFTIGFSALIPRIGTQYAFFAYPLMTMPLLILAFTTGEENRGGGVKKRLSFREMGVGRLFHDYYYVTYLIFAVVLNIPLHCSTTFLPYLLESIGVEASLFGALTGYRALLEIIPLLLMAKLRSRFRMPHIIMAAAVCYVIEMTCYPLARNFTDLCLVATVQGLGGGIFLGVGTNYVFSLAPDHLKATAQTFNGSMNAVAGITGNLLGGVLITQLGVKPFYLMAGGVILAALLLFAVSFPLGERVLRKPRPRAALPPGGKR